MSWIALKMLVGDKAKFLGIVLGLTFAALLIAQQGSIFCGLMCRTAAQVTDITGADLWVMDGNVRYIDDVKPMLESSLYRVRGVEGVEWAVPLYKGQARAKINSTGYEKGPDGSNKYGKYFEVIEQVILLGLDDTSLVGAPPPERILVGSLTDLRKPDAVIVDYNRLQKLFPGENWTFDVKDAQGNVVRMKEPARTPFGRKVAHAVGQFLASPIDGGSFLVGQASWCLDQTIGAVVRKFGVAGGSSRPFSMDLSHLYPYPFESLDRKYDEDRGEFCKRFLGRELEMNDHRAIIVGVCDATRTFQSNSVVYTTYSRAKGFAPQERKILSYVLAKADAKVGPDAVARRIAAQTGLRARSSHEFFWDTVNYYLKYTGIPINFGITAALGFVIGTAIAGQTFYLFTIDNLKQFGALKAMGATNLTIVGMILLQATVVGLLGYGIGIGLAALFGEATKGGELAFFMPWQMLPITGVSVVVICILSSFLSVRRVVVLEPAVVFRG